MFRFVPIKKDDAPLLRRWLGMPHAQEWWGDPDEEIKLIYDGERTGESKGFMAHRGGKPFAYIQCWPCDAQPDKAIVDAPWIRDQTPGTWGVDITIGEPTLLGNGLGSMTVAAFADKLFAEGIPRLIIDPDQDNKRAVRAYEKAGFTAFDTHTHNDGSVTLLMERFPPKEHFE